MDFMMALKITSATKTGTSFEIRGQRFIAFNGGSHYKLNPAISLFISCSTQAEVDALCGFLDW